MRHLYEDDYDEYEADEYEDDFDDEDELSMFTINTCNEWLYTYNPDQDMDYFLFKVLDDGVSPEEVVQYLVEVEGWEYPPAQALVKRGPYGDYRFINRQEIQALDSLFGSCQDYETFVELASDDGHEDNTIVKYLVNFQGVDLREALELLEII